MELNLTMRFPQIDSALPQRGNFLSRTFTRAIFWLIGWQLEGSTPPLAKFVIIAAPHKSNWDFFLCFLIWSGLGAHMHWMVKHTFDRWPIRGLLRLAGGVPINRSVQNDVVGDMVGWFEQEEKLIVAMMPEGTRRQADSPVDTWKTGFYYIADRADVPIMPIYFDRAEKRAILGQVIFTTGDLKADLASIQDFYTNPTASENVLPS